MPKAKIPAILRRNFRINDKRYIALFPLAMVLFLGLFFIGVVKAYAATYYIDPTCASSGDGTTTTCGTHGPFNRWAKVPWAAGNTYSQRGGTTAYEQITVGASGTPGQVITINSYGTENAIINGGIIIPSSSWSGPDSKGVYSQANFGSVILEDGVYLYNSFYTTPTDPPAGQYSWIWYQATEYYHPSSGTPANHTVEKVAEYGININANSYITIQGFSFTKVRYGIYSIPTSSGAASHITITQNDFSNIEFGIWLSYYGDGVASNNTITYNTFDSCMDGIEIYAYGTAGGYNTDMTIAYNTMTHASMVNPPTFAYDWDYVDMNGWDKEGFGSQDLNNSNVYNNSITGHARGIEVYVNPGNTGNNNNYHDNYIITSRAPIVLGPAKNASSFYSNSVYYNILINVEGKTLGGVDDLNPPGSGSDADEGYGLILSNISNPIPTYNTVYNNTIYAGRGCGIAFAPYYVIENNIVYGSGVYMAGSSSNVIIDYNLYYLGEWNNWDIGSAQITWSAWKAAGFDAHGLNVNPQFTNGNGAIPTSTPWVLSYPVPLDMVPSDFTLRSTSPAINAGNYVGLTADFAGNQVSGVPAIGAYEFEGNSGHRGGRR